MIGVLLGMTPFVEIDRTVTSTSGRIVAKEAMNTFQALDPSIIKSIDVREGEEVQTGQLLATLDPTFAAADVVQLRRQLAGLDAQIGRAKAEQDGVRFSQATTSEASTPYADLQEKLFVERSAQLHAQIQSFDEKIKATAASIDGLRMDQAHLSDRVRIAKQIEGMRDSLYKSGSTSLLNLLQATDSSLEMDRSLENNRNSLAELEHEISSLESDRDSATHQWFTASSQELIAAEGQRDATLASLEKALKHQDLVRLSASEPSVVLTLTKRCGPPSRQRSNSRPTTSASFARAIPSRSRWMPSATSSTGQPKDGSSGSAREPSRSTKTANPCRPSTRPGSRSTPCISSTYRPASG